MKTSRLYLHRRQASRRTPSRPQRVPRRKHWWKAASTVVPIAISVAALAVSGLSYWDQHQSSEANASAQQESAARLVTSLWDQNASTLTLQNLGSTKISSIYEVLNIISVAKNSVQPKQARVSLAIDSLPPCSSVTTSTASEGLRSYLQRSVLIKNEIGYAAEPVDIIFEDSSGIFWQENVSSDTLTKIGPTITLGGQTTPFAFAIAGTTKSNNCQ
jgi:hypothetical protein